MWLKNLFRHLTLEFFSPSILLRERYRAFKTLLSHDKRAHEIMADLEDLRIRKIRMDHAALKERYQELASRVSGMVEALQLMNPGRYEALGDIFSEIDRSIRRLMEPEPGSMARPYALELDELMGQGGSLQGAAELAGGKGANLAWLCQELGMPVPRGFVITTNAFRRFVEENGLRGPIDKILAGLDIHDPLALESASKELQDMVLDAEIPEAVKEEARKAFFSLSREAGAGLRVAVRSSALSEDARMTFAGQYKTVLNVDEEGLFAAYLQVLASKYSPRALFYRISCGYSDQETAMAALVLEMVEARASGVIHSRVKDAGEEETLHIYCIQGQGELLVSGKATADLFVVSKEKGFKILRRAHGRGETGCPLSEGQVLRLARWANSIEEAAGVPQDVEWCLDTSGRLFILQARPLLADGNTHDVSSAIEPPASAPVLLSGGETASPGAGAGRVFKLSGRDSLAQVPEGAVLVAPQALAHYAVVLDRVRAVVTDSGSPAGHLALVAREFQVPVLVNTRSATRDLPQGEMVTVFADHTVVVRGNHIPEDLQGQSVSGLPFKDNPFFNRLRLMLRFISPLNLTDPAAENFRPEGCRTLHDIVRYCHEQAVREMFSSAEGISGARGAKRLVSELPITMYVVDLGGGLVPEADALREITPDQITSSPLRAVWRGLAEPEICWSDLTRFDWKGFDQVLMAGGMASKGSAGLATYAVISSEYLNLNMRFGYHFLVLDSICSQDAQRNYIVFRFAGGGGDMAGRLLRMEFLRLVLERLGFETSSKADMLDAHLMAAASDITEAALEQLGRLAAVTQLMDMYLKDSSMAARFAEDFLRGDYSFARRMEPEMCRAGAK